MIELLPSWEKFPPSRKRSPSVWKKSTPSKKSVHRDGESWHRARKSRRRANNSLYGADPLEMPKISLSVCCMQMFSYLFATNLLKVESIQFLFVVGVHILSDVVCLFCIGRLPEQNNKREERTENLLN